MIEIKIIESGYIMADGGAMFGAIPKRAWKRKYDSDENNLCRLAMRCVLVVTDERKILIDLGMGIHDVEKMSYYQPQDIINVADSLDNFGFTASDITDVVLTHLHFDHCGSATRATDDGRFVPTFPNAKYWLSRKQWNNYENPNRLERDSIFASTIQPIYDADLLNLIDEDTYLCEGVELRLFDGHSNGQILVQIKTEDGITAVPSDLIPTAAHVPIDWISAYDISAIRSASEKERFLNEAADNNYTLIYYHDERVVSSRVKRLNDSFIACDQYTL